MKNVKVITDYTNCLKAMRMARSTQNTYLAEFKSFISHFDGEDYRYISRDKIIGYLAHLYDAGYSASKVNQAINAIKFYKEKVLGQSRHTYFVKRPRREKFIPCILSEEQMFSVINSPANLKHRTLLFVMYDNGLRRGELMNLKLSDIRSKVTDPHIVIRKTKHGGDRVIYITDECLNLIREYYLEYKPKTYLFEGAEPGKPISETTISNILKASLKKQGISDRFRVHDIRHNFATHCLLNGTDIYHLSKILGHRSVSTTERYYAHLLPDQVKVHRPSRKSETKIVRLRKVG